MADETSSVATPDQSFSAFLKDAGLPTGAEVKKEATASFEKHKAARAPLLKQQDELLKQMETINDGMAKIKAPATPQFHDLPEPPQQKFRDPMQALGGVGAVIAMLGSLKTRAPLTAALNAGASAMVGFHKGDQEKAGLEQKKWEDNMYRALQQNQMEMQKYTAALKEADFDIAKAQSGFRVIAAENDHVSMKVALEAQDYGAQMAILDGSLKANMEAVKIFSAHKDRQAQIEALKDYRKTALGHKDSDKKRAESWKARNEFQKRVAPIDKSISGLDGAEELLRGSTPGEKIMGARALQRVVGGSERLKADATQMQNFGDIMTRLQGFISKGVWGELTDAQYQQLLAGVKSLRGKENARRKSVEQDIRNLVGAGELDEAIVFGENPEATPDPEAPAAPAPGARDLDFFLLKNPGGRH